MPTSRHYARCRNCGAHRDDGASLSKRGLCIPCRDAIWKREVDALHYHKGPDFKNWRRAHAAAVGGVLVDDILEAE
jgi:hypothetical protein